MLTFVRCFTSLLLRKAVCSRWRLSPVSSTCLALSEEPFSVVADLEVSVDDLPVCSAPLVLSDDLVVSSWAFFDLLSPGADSALFDLLSPASSCAAFLPLVSCSALFVPLARSSPVLLFD